MTRPCPFRRSCADCSPTGVGCRAEVMSRLDLSCLTRGGSVAGFCPNQMAQTLPAFRQGKPIPSH